MKLIRLAALLFEKLPDDPQAVHVEDEECSDPSCKGINLWTLGTRRTDRGTLMLVCSETELTELPHLTDDGLIVIPDGPREILEYWIESIANAISVAEHTRREIASPIPAVALQGLSDGGKDLLRRARGIGVSATSIKKVEIQVGLEDSVSLISDRPDGLALLSEAISQRYSTGRYHDFLRLFERAFSASSSKLSKLLYSFLKGSPFKCTRGEVKNWISTYRHPSVHAEKHEHLVLEADVSRFIFRVEQAAYDVLFNKSEWNSESIERRELWRPDTGVLRHDEGFFITAGSGTYCTIQMLDEFGSYPINLECVLRHLPDDWWTKQCSTSPKREASA